MSEEFNLPFRVCLPYTTTVPTMQDSRQLSRCMRTPDKLPLASSDSTRLAGRNRDIISPGSIALLVEGGAAGLFCFLEGRQVDRWTAILYMA